MNDVVESALNRLEYLRGKAIMVDEREGLVGPDYNFYKFIYDRFLVAHRNVALELMRKDEIAEAVSLYTKYILSKYPNELDKLVYELQASSQLITPLTEELLKDYHSRGFNILVSDIGVYDDNAVSVVLEVPEEEVGYFLHSFDDYSIVNIEYMLDTPSLIKGYLDVYNTDNKNSTYPYQPE